MPLPISSGRHPDIPVGPRDRPSPGKRWNLTVILLMICMLFGIPMIAFSLPSYTSPTYEWSREVQQRDTDTLESSNPTPLSNFRSSLQSTGRLDTLKEYSDKNTEQILLQIFQQSFQTADDPSPDTPIFKCLTPAVKYYREHREELSADTRQQINRLIQQAPQLSGSPDSLLSPSGKFEIHYTTAGDDSVPATDRDRNGIPDYVEWAAAHADTTWQYEISRLGYPDPLQQQPEPYDIYFVESGNYGATFRQQEGSGTYFVVHRNFNGFPENTDPAGDRKGAVKATIAHEFKHAINYFITDWSGEVDNWTEMDATLMEELVYDEVNDYYNYIQSDFSIFSAPSISLSPGRYQHVSFALYFTETFGELFWTRLWEDIEEGYGSNENPTMIGRIDSVLAEESDLPFPHHFARNHLWHFASGSTRVAQNFGFSERFNEFKEDYAYPSSRLYQNHPHGVPDTTSDYRTVQNLAAHHINIIPHQSDYGPVQVSLRYDSTQIAVGLIGYQDGSVKTHFKTSRNQDSVLITPDWWWNEVERLGLVVTNPEPNNVGVPYKIEYGTLEDPIVETNIPKQDELRPNYPNPFNQSTTLNFFLIRRQDVRIRVYDVTGRLVRTLKEGRMGPGWHRIRFDASDLSSGLYLYRVVTELRAMTGKMTLIK